MFLKLLSRVICLTEERPVGQKISAFGIPVHALNMQKGRVTICGLMGLRKLSRQIQPDILQTWMYHANLLGALVGKCCHSALLCGNIRYSNIDLNKYRAGTRITVNVGLIVNLYVKELST